MAKVRIYLLDEKEINVLKHIDSVLNESFDYILDSTNKLFSDVLDKEEIFSLVMARLNRATFINAKDLQ